MAVKDNWNWSRSNLFFGLPFYHAGLKATYELSKAWTAELMICNGWNNIVDNNSQKSVEASATYKPTDRLTLHFLYFGGVERPTGAPEGEPWRHLFDAWATWDATNTLSFTLNADAGFENEQLRHERLDRDRGLHPHPALEAILPGRAGRRLPGARGFELQRHGELPLLARRPRRVGDPHSRLPADGQHLDPAGGPPRLRFYRDVLPRSSCRRREPRRSPTFPTPGRRPRSPWERLPGSRPTKSSSGDLSERSRPRCSSGSDQCWESGRDPCSVGRAGDRGFPASDRAEVVHVYIAAANSRRTMMLTGRLSPASLFSGTDDPDASPRSALISDRVGQHGNFGALKRGPRVRSRPRGAFHVCGGLAGRCSRGRGRGV